MLPGLAALDDADRGDRSSAGFGSAGLASLCMAREVSDSGDSVVRTVWPAEAGRPSVCRVAGVGPSTAGVGPVTAVSEHAASRTHVSTVTGISAPILTPSALTTPATVPGPVGARCVEPCHREKTRRNLLSATCRRLSFPPPTGTTVWGRGWTPPKEHLVHLPAASPVTGGQGWTPHAKHLACRASRTPVTTGSEPTASVEHEITIARARRG